MFVFFIKQKIVVTTRSSTGRTSSAKTSSSSAAIQIMTSVHQLATRRIKNPVRRMGGAGSRSLSSNHSSDAGSNNIKEEKNLVKNINVFHPRIKYSVHKNPIKTQTTNITNASAAATTNNATEINLAKKPNQITVNTPNKIKRDSYSELELIQSGDNSNVDDDIHSSIMTDLANYAEIDDIELPDGSQIGFGDVDEFNQQHDGQQTSTSLDDDYNMLSNNTLRFEYMSDSAASAGNDESGRQYVCRHCNKGYRWKSTLRRHENVECGGKEPMHQCPHCPYKAKQRGNLGVHIRKHHTAMPPLESRRKLNRSM